MQTLKIELLNWLHSKHRIINLLIGLGAVVLYEIARATYRPYIYSQGINDFHIADTIGNSLGTIATIFVFTSLLGRNLAQEYLMIRTVTISVAVYELAHPLLGTADRSMGSSCDDHHRGALRNPLPKNQQKQKLTLP